jgi:hypothetical protein
MAILKRARIRSFFAEGVKRFHVAVTVEAIPALLHVSVSLFLAGLIISLFTIHHTVAYVVLATTAVCTLMYTAITVMPAIYHDSPYVSLLSTHMVHLSKDSPSCVHHCRSSGGFPREIYELRLQKERLDDALAA